MFAPPQSASFEWQSQSSGGGENGCHACRLRRRSLRDRLDRLERFDLRVPARARIAALGALAELYGLHQPKAVYVTLPTLAQLEAEIARRQVQ